jgi:hypothetical protein
MRKNAPFLVVLALVVGLLDLVVFQYGRLQQAQHRLEIAYRLKSPVSFDNLSSIELEAVKEWVLKGDSTMTSALEGYEVRSVRMGEETCVVLFQERGTIDGGDPVYCFDGRGKLVRKFDEFRW